MARQRIAPEVKAAAIADLATGEQPAIVAQRYRLNRQTVKAWRSELQPPPQPSMMSAVQPQVIARQATLAELVEANLRAKLIATQRIAEYVTQEDWFSRQNAADVATLFAALDNSAVGILDRLAGTTKPDAAA